MKRLVLAIFVFGCGGSSDPGSTVLTVDATQFATEGDIGEQAPTPSVPDTSSDTAFVAAPEPIPYQPCAENVDCPSGYCVESADGRTCTRECVSDCPSGWACTSVSGTGSDVVFLCVPRFVTLCMPCTSDSECADGGLADGACLDYGHGGRFCGAACSPDAADCPNGYACDAGQCRKDDGLCECTWKAVKEAASTTCSAVSEVGTCTGTRGCLDATLSACTAATPVEESCNGADDDCDGSTDDGIVEIPCSVSSDEGTCTGVTQCSGGAPACTAQVPSAEICDGKDNDCDTLPDEGFPDADANGVADCVSEDDDGDGIPDLTDNCPATPNTDQADLDADLVGDVCDPDLDGDGDPNTTDCAPADPTVGHEATEICDGADQDCDALVDEGFADLDKDTVADCVDDDDDGDGDLDPVDNCPVTPNPTQSDTDGDQKGDACEDDLDGDGDPDLTDCAPSDPNVKHGATESCNGADENCNGIVDEGFPDTDADGVMNCLDPDDDDDGVPDGSDLCGLKDDPEQLDTDGDLLGDACDTDDDGDGSPDVLDCGPTDAAVSPKAAEVCNGKDDDCDSIVDEAGAEECTEYLFDNDGDGFGVSASQCLCGPKAPYTATAAGDCNDQNGLVFPGAAESCNGTDDNCNSEKDEGAAVGCVDSMTDADNDGFGAGPVACRCPGTPGVSTLGGDCDDGDPGAKPGALETCNGKDDNCNTLSDEQGAFGCQSYYRDGDNDGVGAAEVKCLCAGEGLFTAGAGGDCNDADADIAPAHPELCDQKDNNCNGQLDEGVQKTWFLDEDGDGSGASYSPQMACTQPEGFTAKAGDCNDFNKDIHPQAPETCNDVDDDCDGLADDGLATQVIYKDNDGDSFAASNAPKQSKCNVPVGWVLALDANGDGANDWDCSDSDITVFPAGPTVCGDGKDNDCDGVIDRLCFTPCAGTWPYEPDYASGGLGAVAVDLHGDGNAEIVVTHTFGFGILGGDGVPLYDYSAPTYNYARTLPAFADFDDGNTFGAGIQGLELVTGTNSQASLYKVTPAGVVTKVDSGQYVYDASRYLVQDIDNDGQPEFITSTWCDNGVAARVFRYQAGALTLVREVPAPTGACNYFNGRALTDLDGDGTPELMWGEGYGVPNQPSYWSGEFVVRRFSPASTLTVLPFCSGPTCFPGAIDGHFGGSTGELIRFPTEVRAIAYPFLSNTNGVTNAGTTQTLRFQLNGARISAESGASLWRDTSDVDDDGVLESYGNDIANVGLFDVNADGFPDRITSSGKSLRVQLWDPKNKAFKTNVGSDHAAAASNVSVQSIADLDGDGRLQVVASDSAGGLYCHELGPGTWNTGSSLPPAIPAAYRTNQWDNFEPNDGGDANADGLPDRTLRIPSALTATGAFTSYLSTATDKDYYLVDTDWSARICLRAPKGRTYGLEVYAFADRWNNATKLAPGDGKPDGLIWQDTGAFQHKCFSATNVTPYRQGEFKFIIGVVPLNGSHSPHWPYSLSLPK